MVGTGQFLSYTDPGTPTPVNHFMITTDSGFEGVWNLGKSVLIILLAVFIEFRGFWSQIICEIKLPPSAINIDYSCLGPYLYSESLSGHQVFSILSLIIDQLMTLRMNICL